MSSYYLCLSMSTSAHLATLPSSDQPSSCMLDEPAAISNFQLQFKKDFSFQSKLCCYIRPITVHKVQPNDYRSVASIMTSLGLDGSRCTVNNKPAKAFLSSLNNNTPGNSRVTEWFPVTITLRTWLNIHENNTNHNERKKIITLTEALIY